MPFETSNPLVLKPAPYIPLQMNNPSYGAINFISGAKPLSDEGKQWVSNRCNFLLEMMKFIPEVEAQTYFDNLTPDEQYWEYSKDINNRQAKFMQYDVALDERRNPDGTYVVPVSDGPANPNPYISRSFGAMHSQTLDNELIGQSGGARYKDFIVERDPTKRKRSFNYFPAFYDYYHTDDEITDVNFFMSKAEYSSERAYADGTDGDIRNDTVPVWTDSDGSNYFQGKDMPLLENVGGYLRPAYYPTDYTNAWFGMNTRMLFDPAGRSYTDPLHSPTNASLPNIASISPALFQQAQAYFRSSSIFSHHNDVTLGNLTVNKASICGYTTSPGTLRYAIWNLLPPARRTTAELNTVLNNILSELFSDPSEPQMHFKPDAIDILASSQIESEIKDIIYRYWNMTRVMTAMTPEQIDTPSFYELVKDPYAPWNYRSYTDNSLTPGVAPDLLSSELQKYPGGNMRKSTVSTDFLSSWGADANDDFAMSPWWSSRTAEWGKIAFYLAVLMLESRRRYFSAMTELIGPPTTFDGFTRSDKLREQNGVPNDPPDNAYDIGNSINKASLDYLMIKYQDRWISNKYVEGNDSPNTWLSQNNGNVEKEMFRSIALAQHRLSYWAAGWRNGYLNFEKEIRNFTVWMNNKLKQFFDSGDFMAQIQNTGSVATAKRGYVDTRYSIANNLKTLDASRKTELGSSLVTNYNTVLQLKDLTISDLKVGSYRLSKYYACLKALHIEDIDPISLGDLPFEDVTVEGTTTRYYWLTDAQRTHMTNICNVLNTGSEGLNTELFNICDFSSTTSAKKNNAPRQIMYELFGDTIAGEGAAAFQANYNQQIISGFGGPNWDCTYGHTLYGRYIVDPNDGSYQWRTNVNHYYSPMNQTGNFTNGEIWSGYVGVERAVDRSFHLTADGRGYTWATDPDFAGSPDPWPINTNPAQNNYGNKYDYQTIYLQPLQRVWMTHIYGGVAEPSFGAMNMEAMTVMVLNRQSKKRYDTQTKRYSEQKEEDFWDYVEKMRSIAQFNKKRSDDIMMYKKRGQKIAEQKNALKRPKKK